ncbi:MAG: hypothetical protein WCF24_06520 [Acidimicrobiales bacterium]
MADDERDDTPINEVPEVAPLPALKTRLQRIGKALAGPRQRPPTGGDSTAQAVNELDERERKWSLAGVVLGAGLVISGYLIDRHSAVERVRTASGTLLIAGIVVLVIMALGIVFRRRAMVGFASFMVGFALITGGNVFGVLFLGFGGWLLVRALRRQRERSGPKPESATATKSKPPPKPAGPPKPSKRYTPPRRSRVGSRRR